MNVIHSIAKRRFNYVDTFWIGIASQAAYLHHYWIALAAIALGVLVSVSFELLSEHLS